MSDPLVCIALMKPINEHPSPASPANLAVKDEGEALKHGAQLRTTQAANAARVFTHQNDASHHCQRQSITPSS